MPASASIAPIRRPLRPRISIIIPVYNKYRFLRPVVDAACAAVQEYGDAEIVIVDNGSTDGSFEWLGETYGDRIRLSRLVPGTISAVRNYGARQAGGELLCFLDCDCVMPPDYLSRIGPVLLATGATGTGCRVGLPPAPTWVEATWYGMHAQEQDGERAWINSGNFIVWRDAFEAVGGFDEALITGEDAEICQRLTDAGHRLYESHRLQVAHLDNAKTLPTFFRKEIWRALGMFGTVNARSLDKPTAMMFAHLAMLGIAGGLMLWGPRAAGPRIGWGLVLAFAVPALTVAYRARTSGNRFSLWRGLVLYQLYYLARLTALARILAGATRETAPRPSPQPNSAEL